MLAQESGARHDEARPAIPALLSVVIDAGAAGPAIADALGDGEIQVVAQGVDQGDARLNRSIHGLAVDVERDGHRAGADRRRSGRGFRLTLEQPCGQSRAAYAYAANEPA